MVDIKYNIVIGYNEASNYSIVMEKFTLVNGQKTDITSVVKSNLTLEECLILQSEFIK